MIEGPYKLPSGWRWVRLEEACETIMGQSPPGQTYNNERKGLPFFQGKADFGDLYPIPNVWCTSPLKLAQPGDVLISVRAPVGPTNLAKELCCIGRGLAALRPKNGLEQMWLLYYLRNAGTVLASYGKGSAFSAITKKQLIDFLLPLPPPDEQRRIIEKLEALMERVLEAKRLHAASRKDADQIVDIARDEVLGELGTVPFGTLVASYKNGIYKQKQYYGRGYPSVRMFNIKNGMVNLENAPLLDVTIEELQAFGLVQDDLLVNRVNSRELVGKSGLVPPGLGPCTFESKNIRVRLRRELAEPAFVVAGLNSANVRRQILGKMKPAIGQATINQDDLNKLHVPFINDLKEQRRIVAYLNQIQAKAVNLKRVQEEAERELHRLEQAILDKAFRGEL